MSPRSTLAGVRTLPSEEPFVKQIRMLWFAALAGRIEGVTDAFGAIGFPAAARERGSASKTKNATIDRRIVHLIMEIRSAPKRGDSLVRIQYITF
jgi:hypothetical protein